MLCRASFPPLGLAVSCGREASSSWGSRNTPPSPAGVGLDRTGAPPPLQAAAHCALDRLVTGPLAGWLGRLINILRNDLAMGSGTACHWGLMAGFFSSFPIVSAIFTTGRPAAPSPRRLTGWGLGDSPVWFLAEGLGESVAWKGNRQGLDYASPPHPTPCPASLKPHPIALWPWQDGNKKHSSRRRSQTAQLSLEEPQGDGLGRVVCPPRAAGGPPPDPQARRNGGGAPFVSSGVLIEEARECERQPPACLWSHPWRDCRAPVFSVQGP